MNWIWTDTCRCFMCTADNWIQLSILLEFLSFSMPCQRYHLWSCCDLMSITWASGLCLFAAVMRQVTGDLKVHGGRKIELYTVQSARQLVAWPSNPLPLSSEYHDFYYSSKIWVTSNRTARFPINFSFRSVTWYLRISLQCIWRILSLGCDATHCDGYLHILEHSK